MKVPFPPGKQIAGIPLLLAAVLAGCYTHSGQPGDSAPGISYLDERSLGRFSDEFPNRVCPWEVGVPFERKVTGNDRNHGDDDDGGAATAMGLPAAASVSTA